MPPSCRDVVAYLLSISLVLSSQLVAALLAVTSSLTDTERRKVEYIGSPSRKYRLRASFSITDGDGDDVTCTPPAAVAVLLRASVDVRLAGP